ncbi:MAG: TlpA disulfide reductase family protein [Vicingaceae bacterium]
MKTYIYFLTLLLFSSSIIAQNSSLVGEKAPEIEVREWLNFSNSINEKPTDSVLKGLRGNVVVLDFWFTKCAPCVASIPKLNGLSRQYPEVVFLSISFDDKSTINSFLEKLQLFYPVGSDPTMKTIDSYGVTLFPETFVIDQKGFIKWQGSPFHLEEELFNELLGVEAHSKSLTISDNENPNKNPAYTLMVQKHTLEMGRSSYSHSNPYDLNILNYSLAEILSSQFNINKSRIISTDSTMMQTTYDVRLEADKSQVEEYETDELIKYLLPKELGFNFIAVEVDTLVNVISISDSTLLKLHKSNVKNGVMHSNRKKVEMEGYRLTTLKDFIENEFNQLIELDKNIINKTKYDFTLPIKNFKEFEEALLRDYGIKLSNEKKKITFYKVLKEE